MKEVNEACDKRLRISFVSSAYNEEANLGDLYEQCLNAFDALCRELPDYHLAFSLQLVDNCSLDHTPQVIKQLMSRDQRVSGIRNLRNYGPEPSFMEGLRLANADLIVLLCADLQDPPEIARQMLHKIITSPSPLDAVLACKQRSAGSALIRAFRKLYYRLLSFSDRDRHVFPGFHGFGCYRREALLQALEYWEHTAMNMRQCLSSACSNPEVVTYEQPDRSRGQSSYSFVGYFTEASQGIMVGKSLASRLSLRMGVFVFMLSVVIGIFVILNYATGRSGYAPGVPTLALLILLSSSFQVIMLSLVSRQIETGLFKSSRPNVRFRHL